jgi:serine/threonine protein kinase
VAVIEDFERALGQFLAGDIEFAQLDAMRRDVLASAPESEARIQHSVRDLYARGRLPQQLFAALGGRSDEDAAATGNSGFAASADQLPPPDEHGGLDENTRFRPRAPAGDKPSPGGGAGSPGVHAHDSARDSGARADALASAGAAAPPGDDRTVRTQRTASGAGGEQTIRTQREAPADRDDKTVRTQRDGPARLDEQTVRTHRPGSDVESKTPDGVPGVGSVIKGRFVLESVIGLGGMGVVFAARDLRKEEAQDSNPYVAMKILNAEFRRHPQALITLQRESRKAQALAHPNIINVFDFDRDAENVFMTMELLQGQTLLQLIQKHDATGLSTEKGVPIVTAIASGLAYAHKRGTIHSDLKPGNIFVTDDDQVKILDFDIARTIRYGADGGDSESADPVFDAGDLGGMTPGYASLEMLNGERAEMSDDIYALAVTAYQLLTGRHPFDRMTADEAFRQGRSPKPIKGLKRREWKAIARGLAFKRADRQPDATAFLREFRGTTPITRSIAATILILAVLAMYFAFESIQPEGPKIPFEELPLDVQTQVTTNLERAEVFMTMQRYQQARSMFEDVYNIHEGNPDATDGLDRILELKLKEMRGPATLADLERYMADLDGFESSAYFKQNTRLLEAREDLERRIRELR